MKLQQIVEEFLTQAIEAGGWMALDRLYLRNRVYGILAVAPEAAIELPVVAEDYLAALINFQESRQLRSDQLADLLTPPPSVINALFAQRYEKDPYDATAYFYQLNKLNKRVASVQASQSVSSNYGELAYYPTWQSPVPQNGSYPKCSFCMENEGYEGTGFADSQLTQRMIRMNLAGQTWNYHFVTAPAWEEECLFTAEDHNQVLPLEEKVSQLNQLNNLFPHYSVVSLGALPTHPAYWGGTVKLPVTLAKATKITDSVLFKGVTISEVTWPVPTIRFQGSDSQMLTKGVTFFLLQIKEQLKCEPIVIFSDHQELKQVELILGVTGAQSELALGILSGEDSVTTFNQLEQLTTKSDQELLKQVLQEL